MAMRKRRERGRKLPQVKPNQKNSVGKGRKKGKKKKRKRKKRKERRGGKTKKKEEEVPCVEERRKKKKKKRNDTSLRDLRLTGGRNSSE